MLSGTTQNNELYREADMARIIRAAKRDVYEVLDLSKMGLTTFPIPILCLTHLAELHLHHNFLTHIPYCIADFKFLKELDVEHNKLATLPVEALEKIKSLKKLKLRGNPIALLMPTELLDGSADQILKRLNYKQNCLSLRNESPLQTRDRSSSGGSNSLPSLKRSPVVPSRTGITLSSLGKKSSSSPLTSNSGSPRSFSPMTSSLSSSFALSASYNGSLTNVSSDSSVSFNDESPRSSSAPATPYSSTRDLLQLSNQPQDISLGDSSEIPPPSPPDHHLSIRDPIGSGQWHINLETSNTKN